MSFLLTGFNGFIGRNIMNEMLPTYSLDYIEKDFMDNEDWEKRLENSVSLSDGILHIGAISDTMLSDSNEMLKYNYWFSKRLFEMCKKHNKKVVYASSAATTGTNGIPTNIYGWSKLLAEQYGLVLGGDFIALRYFNVYGPREEKKGKMASVAYQAYKKGSFKLFPRNPKRDFVYVKDIVDATVKALFEDVPNGVYEVGSGESRTFENVLDLMEIEYSYYKEDKIPKGYQFFTKSDSNNWLPDWKPKYNLDTGIRNYKKILDKMALK